jgi:hypothetical protein
MMTLLTYLAPMFISNQNKVVIKYVVKSRILVDSWIR